MSSPYQAFDSDLSAADAWEDASEMLDQDRLRNTSVNAWDDLKDTTNAADASLEELDAVARGFRQRMATEADRLDLVTMTDFYTCVVFPTGKQMRAFLDQTGWGKYGDYGGWSYLDGRKVAEHLGIDIGPDPEWPAQKRDATYDSLAMSVDDNRAEVAPTLSPERQSAADTVLDLVELVYEVTGEDHGEEVRIALHALGVTLEELEDPEEESPTDE